MPVYAPSIPNYAPSNSAESDEPPASEIIREAAAQLFSALRDDIYPDPAVAQLFGIKMGDEVGASVYYSWVTLKKRSVLDYEDVLHALRTNTIPKYFESKIRNLPRHEQTIYTRDLIEKSWILRIDWAANVQLGLAHAYALETGGTPQRAAPAPAPAREADAADVSRRLFPEGAVKADSGQGASQSEKVSKTQKADENDVSVQWMRDEHIKEYLLQKREWVIRHLTSEKGRALNGKTCTVVGRDKLPWPKACRMHVKIEGSSGEALKLHTWNLAKRNNTFRSANPSKAAPLPQAKLLELLRGVVRHFESSDDLKTSERVDEFNRFNYLKEHVSQGRIPPPVRCCDPLCPEDQLPDWIQAIVHMRPCCSGDNTCDLTRFGEGLEVDDKDDKQLIVRLKEWVVSGMCERCQIVCHERKDGGVQGLAGDAVAAEAFEKARKAMTMEVS